MSPISAKEPPDRHAFNKGDMILLTNGEYSDFRVIGTYQALRDFVSGEAKEVIKAAKRAKRDSAAGEHQYLDEPEMAKALQGAGLIGEEVGSKQLHLDD